MTLRKKTIIGVSSIFVCLIIILYSVSQNILLGSYQKLELDFVNRNNSIALDALYREISSIESSNRDWASWDDTYQFIEDHNEEYLASNLADLSFNTLKLNVILYYNSKKELVYKKGYDLINHVEVPAADVLQGNVENNPLLIHDSPDKGVSGIVMLQNKPLLISACPILKSSGDGPIRGTLIMGRFVSEDMVKYLSQVTKLQLSFLNFHDNKLGNDIRSAFSMSPVPGSCVVRPIDDNTIAAYYLIKDVYGEPGIVLKTEMPRSIINQGKNTIEYFMLLLVIIGVVFCLALSLILGKVLLSKLVSISNAISQIGETGDFSSRISLKGNDELGKLANTFNYMLDALESYITKLKTRTDELAEARSYMESVFGVVGDGIGVVTADGVVKSCNQTIFKMFGYTPEEIIGKKLSDFLPHGSFEKFVEKINMLAVNNILRYETIVARKDGSRFPIEICCTFLKDNNEITIGVVFSIRDISDQKAREIALKRKAEEQALLLDNIDIQVWYLNDAETYGAVNEAHASFLGISKEMLENRKIRDILKNAEEIESYIESNKKVFESKKQVRYISKVNLTGNDERYLSFIKTPKLDESGKVEYIICSAEDITVKKLAEDEIKYLSFHDNLTGLFNRAFFEQELKRLDTPRQLPLSVIIGDLNGLKITNDVFGHNCGDDLLKNVANIIKSACREDDIIARWGGDEFSIILPKTSEGAALEICDRITKACSQAQADPIQPSIALGSACKHTASEDIDSILKKAESRMYRHKLLEDKSARSSVISLMEKTLNERSFETREHAQRLQHVAVLIGETLGLRKSELDELKLLAALHDIGKIAIPDNILNKESSLTQDEWEVMKKHPEIGYRIAKSCPEFAPVADSILSHHECYDGSGYPQGLKGDEIPLSARIISIADTFDAMTHDRPYKKAVSIKEAIAEIERCSGMQFDPKLVQLFSIIARTLEPEH